MTCDFFIDCYGKRRCGQCCNNRDLPEAERVIYRSWYTRPSGPVKGFGREGVIDKIKKLVPDPRPFVSVDSSYGKPAIVVGIKGTF